MKYGFSRLDMSKLRSTISKTLPVLGLLLFMFILYRVGAGSIWENLKTLNFFYFAIAVLLLVPAVFIKAYKWRGVLNSLGFSFSLFESFKVMLISYFIGSITPARLGDFSRALYLKKHKMSLPKAVSSVLIDRIFDLGVLILMAVLSVITLVHAYSLAYSTILVIIIIAISFACVVILLLKKKLMRRILKPFFYMLIPEKYQKNLINVFDDFYKSISLFSQDMRASLSLAFLTLLTWLVSFLSVYFAALALGIEISYFILLLILPFTTLVEMLPISFSGIGTRDAVLILIFSLIMIPASKAVSLSVMILILNYIMNVAGALFWLKNSFKL